MVRRVKPRYFVAKPSGYYWLPGPHARARGYSNEALGADLAKAIARAEFLNNALDNTRASDALPAPSSDSLASTIAQYERSRAFTSLATKTKRGYRQCAADVIRWGGDIRPERITTKAVGHWYLKMSEVTPAKANATIRYLRLLMSWCRSQGLVASNPASPIKLTGLKPRTRKWDDEEVEAFCKKADELGRHSMTVAVLLARNLGQREGDLLALTWSCRKNGKLLLKQRKTDIVVHVRETQILTETLRDLKRTRLEIIVSEATGDRYKEDHFRHEFARIRKAAKLPADLLFMDLRRTAVVELGRAGCTAIEIANITGHTYKSVNTILETYLPRDSEMAEGAIKKVEDYRARIAAKRGENAEV